MMFDSLPIALLSLLAATTEMDMMPGEAEMINGTKKAVTMEHTVEADTVALAVVGQARSNMTVDYEIELSGRSLSRHRGKTTLAGGERTVLSRFTVSTGGSPWCARMSVSQSDGTRYHESTGPACQDGGGADRRR